MVRGERVSSLLILGALLSLFVSAMAKTPSLQSSFVLLSFDHPTAYTHDLNATEGTLTLTFKGESPVALQKSITFSPLTHGRAIEKVAIVPDAVQQGARLTIALHKGDDVCVRLLPHADHKQLLIAAQQKRHYNAPAHIVCSSSSLVSV